MIINSMTDLIGNTPLLKVPDSITGLKNIDVYAKLEMMNPFGSVKDRTAWGMIKDDLVVLQNSGKIIYENSSGNTAKSLQAIANIYGLKFHLVSALNKVVEQKHVLQVMGSEIEEIATASDCFDPSDPNDPQYIIERMVTDKPDGIYFPSQFTNIKNPEYHEITTAEEILNDIGSVDYFFGGLGTAGSILGITKKLKQANSSLESVGVVAETGHFIPGIRNMSQMMESTLFAAGHYSKIYSLTERDALEGMMTLVRSCAVLCGPSSGANYTAAIRHLRNCDAGLTERKTAVFIVCDRMEWYISYIQDRMPELFGGKKQESPLSCFESRHIDFVSEIATHDFDSWQQQHADALIIDIRAAPSFQLVHIRGSINMPSDMFERWISEHNPFSGNCPVVIICAVGERSRHYAAYLNSIGVRGYSLQGGIMAWHDFREAA